MNSTVSPRNSSVTLRNSTLGDGETLLLYGRYTTTMPILGAVIVAVNIVGILIISKSKTIAKNLMVYIISLMTCDLLTGLNLLVCPLIYWLFAIRQVVDQSVSIIRTLLLISILHSGGLSVDRLLSVKQPNLYQFRVNSKVCKIVCISIWSVMAAYHVIVIMLSSFYAMGGQFDTRIYIIFLSIYFSCLFLYLGSSKIIITCARNHLNRSTLRTQIPDSARDQQMATFRLSIVITTASGFLYMFYLPAQIFVILTFIDPAREMKVTQFFLDISYPMLTLESLLNPILYLLKFRETRQTIKDFCCPSRITSIVTRNTMTTNT